MIIIYIFLTLVILSLALAPTVVNNPVRAVISFIFVFLLVAGILISINIEFLAFVYAIVYIGAVAVLFLFVVMLIQVSTKYHAAFKIHWIILLIIFIILLTIKIINIIINQLSLDHFDKTTILLPRTQLNETNINFTYNGNNIIFNELHEIANKFYSLYSMLFIETAFILLIALIAVIVLTKAELK